MTDFEALLQNLKEGDPRTTAHLRRYLALHKNTFTGQGLVPVNNANLLITTGKYSRGSVIQIWDNDIRLEINEPLKEKTGALERLIIAILKGGIKFGQVVIKIDWYYGMPQFGAEVHGGYYLMRQINTKNYLLSKIAEEVIDDVYGFKLIAQ